MHDYHHVVESDVATAGNTENAEWTLDFQKVQLAAPCTGLLRCSDPLQPGRVVSTVPFFTANAP